MDCNKSGQDLKWSPNIFRAVALSYLRLNHVVTARFPPQGLKIKRTSSNRHSIYRRAIAALEAPPLSESDLRPFWLMARSCTIDQECSGKRLH
jgi:hypothetical protein